MKRSLLIILAGIITLSWLYLAGWVDSGVKQPIEFPHKTHIAQGIPCTGCHQRAEKDLVAGRPPTALCLACHAGGDSTNPEIKKLKAFAGSGQEIPWRRVWRLPSHVFFSHRVHVTVGKVACQTCHGPMETLERPPARPLKTLSMNDCIACHMKSSSTIARQMIVPHPANVSTRRLVNDCVGCHR